MKSTIFVLLLMSFTGFAYTQALKEIRVGATGKGDYTTVQEAIAHVPPRGATIRIAPGTYREKLHITTASVHLLGEGVHANDVVLSWDDSAGSAGGTSKSATLTVTAEGFEAENLTIENTWEKTHTRSEQGAQAVALLLTGDRAVLDRVRLLGAQDTLYANSALCRNQAGADAHQPCQAARQYFRDCYIEGHVDFIFGDAKAVFDHCELHPIQHAQAMLTAQSKYYPEEDSGYYFLDCRVTGGTGGRQIFFGRPWRDYSTVWFVNTEIEPMMNASGWEDWSDRLKTSTFREYNSHGSGVNGGHRVVASPDLSKEEKDALTPQHLLAGRDRWNPVTEANQLRHADER